jgi:hypothetical protein
MKVKELIEKLSKMPGDAEILVEIDWIGAPPWHSHNPVEEHQEGDIVKVVLEKDHKNEDLVCIKVKGQDEDW